MSKEPITDGSQPDGGHRPPLQHRPRLTRLAWLFTDAPLFFVTACTHQRRQLLADGSVHETFREFARRATEHGVWVGRYVLMPDHLHLFVSSAPEAAGLSAWMKSLKNTLSKTLRQQRIPTPHWQKGFFDHVLRSEESYLEKWQYVALNPVRAGLVTKPDDWPFQGEIHELEQR